MTRLSVTEFYEKGKKLLIYFQNHLDVSVNKGWRYYDDWFAPGFLLDFLWRTISNHCKEKARRSLVHFRMLDARQATQWLTLAAYAGVYESIARNLRFILEDIAQALHADQKLIDVSIDDKFEYLKKMETESRKKIRGTNLIFSLDVCDNLKTSSSTLYNELCDYIHPSIKSMRGRLRSALLELNSIYDEAKFQRFLELYKRTYDVILSLILSQYSESIPIFLGDAIKEYLKKAGYSCTLEFANGHSNVE